MRIFRIESANMREIREYGSASVFLSLVVDVERNATIHWMQFDPQGLIGGRYLASPQIFLVVEGDGWVKSNQLEPIPVMMGDGVFWDTGEWQEAGSDRGMTAVLIESKLPDPATFSAHF